MGAGGEITNTHSLLSTPHFKRTAIATSDRQPCVAPSGGKMIL
jgi:hypothetical protein